MGRDTVDPSEITTIDPNPPECSQEPEDTCPPGKVCMLEDCYDGCRPNKPCPNGMQCVINGTGDTLGYYFCCQS